MNLQIRQRIPVTVDLDNRHVTVPGGSVFVRTWRPPETDRLPVVLLHDSLGSVEQWREFPAALACATNRPVIAYDRLGFGHSSRRTDTATTTFIDDEARIHLPAVVNTLSLGRYVLFGHSVGGGMALAAAAVAGSRCAAVISESAQAFVEERTLAGIRAAKQGFEDEARFARLSKWHGERSRWVLEAWTEVWLSPEFRQWSLAPVLGRVRCPVLALHGDADEFGSCEFPRRIAQEVSGPARMQIIGDCGHVPHREKEGEVVALVREFLAENGIP
jgi:pimeloyl-ACP methyl ester carboxylesterase